MSEYGVVVCRLWIQVLPRAGAGGDPLPLESSAIFAHGLTDPIVDEIACQLRTKFFEFPQAFGFNKACQALQML